MPELFHITTEANPQDETKYIATTHVKILVLGAEGVGKTSLIEKYLEDAEVITPDQKSKGFTVGVDSYFHQFNISTRPIKLTIVDTGYGAPRLLMPHYAGAGVVLLCYDRTDLKSLNAIEDYIQEIQACIKQGTISPDVKVLLVETKSDCEKANGIDEKLSKVRARYGLVTPKVCSAVYGDGVNMFVADETVAIIATAESVAVAASDAEFVAEFSARYAKAFTAGFFQSPFTKMPGHIKQHKLTKDIIMQHAKAAPKSRTAAIVNAMQPQQQHVQAAGMSLASGQLMQVPKV